MPFEYSLSDNSRRVILKHDRIDTDSDGIFPIGNKIGRLFMQRTQCYQKINTVGQTRTYQKQDSYIQQYIQRQRIWMKVPQCSIEKEEAILDALKCFKMIKDGF